MPSSAGGNKNCRGNEDVQGCFDEVLSVRTENQKKSGFGLIAGYLGFQHFSGEMDTAFDGS